jgi:hypothetical protein
MAARSPLHYTLAKLFGLITLTAIALAAGSQFGTAMGFLLLVVLYAVVLVEGFRGIDRADRR